MMRGKAALIRNIKARSVQEGQTCAFSHRSCTQPRLDGYEFCLKHILEDKSSPYKQCSYTAPKTNRRCTNAAPKLDRKEGFCVEHQKRVVISRQKAGRKRRPRETAETLFEELATSTTTASDVAADAKRLRRFDSIASKALEYGSSSDSDMEAASVDQAWRRDNDSDAESIDSDQEDPLKHAGVYSQEEGALLLRDKLIRLQSLYIEQFKRLQHVLKEKRRKFLHTYKQERERLGPIQAYKQDPTQRKKYERLQAMKRYHKFFGKEALLHQKCNLRRIAVAEGINHRPPTFIRCVAPTSDGRCNRRVVPLSKFCMAHILKDPHQVLFEPCCFRNGQCREPVFSLDDAPLCRRHYAAATGPSSAAAASQTEDPAEDKSTSDSKIKVDDTPEIHPSASAGQTSGFSGADFHQAGISGGSTSTVPENGGLKDMDELMADVSEGKLNSSGSGVGHFDLGDVDLNMEPDDLIQLVDDDFLEPGNDRNLL